MVTVDSNTPDKLLENTDIASRLSSLVEAGIVRVLFTHVQWDENMNTPDQEKRQNLLDVYGAIGASRVPTMGVVLGESRLDESAFSTPQDVSLLGALSGDSPAHLRDVIISVTGAQHKAILVSEDRGLRARARAAGLECWRFKDLVRFVKDGPHEN